MPHKSKADRLANKRALTARWKLENPERVRQTTRRYRLRYEYGISVEEWDTMLERQGGRCACCGSENPEQRRMHTDHDHETGRVRGIICGTCNRLLGALGDNAEKVRAACARFLRYLEYEADTARLPAENNQ